MDEKNLSPKGLFHELHKLMDTFLSNPFMNFFNTDMVRFNIIETMDSYIVEAELPGYQPKNIELRISGSSLHIHAFKTILQELHNEQDHTYITEQSQERVERTLSFPISLEHKPITASYKNQLLKIIIKKEGFVPKQKSAIFVQS